MERGGGILGGAVGGAGGLSEMFGGKDGAALEASFREFCDRPENKQLVKKLQKKEILDVIRREQEVRACEFQERVLASDVEAQRNVAPFLDVPVLRKIVQTLTNDPRGDFDQWAKNPLILKMLSEAKKALEEKRFTEEEAEHLILQYIKHPSNPASEDFKKRTQLKARLTTEQLIPALNEQLKERYAGNDAYQAKDFPKAMEHYGRALAVLDVVEGVSSADQEEINKNRLSVLLNLAAGHIAQKEFGAAARRCTEALALDPENIKALLRRAKAYTGRREYEAAEADLVKVKDLEPWNFDAEDEAARLRAVIAEDRRKQRDVFGKMFSGGGSRK